MNQGIRLLLFFSAKPGANPLRADWFSPTFVNKAANFGKYFFFGAAFKRPVYAEKLLPFIGFVASFGQHGLGGQVSEQEIGIA